MKSVELDSNVTCSYNIHLSNVGKLKPAAVRAVIMNTAMLKPASGANVPVMKFTNRKLQGGALNETTDFLGTD